MGVYNPVVLFFTYRLGKNLKSCFITKQECIVTINDQRRICNEGNTTSINVQSGFVERINFFFPYIDMSKNSNFLERRVTCNCSTQCPNYFLKLLLTTNVPQFVMRIYRDSMLLRYWNYPEKFRHRTFIHCLDSLNIASKRDIVAVFRRSKPTNLSWRFHLSMKK